MKTESKLLKLFEARFGPIVNGLYDGHLDLSDYAHPLPASFTGCGGSLDLSDYAHPLPASFTGCGGSLDLRYYAHPLPASFTGCGGHLGLSGYAHPLPASFTGCGGSLYLRGYAHPLPASLREGVTHNPIIRMGSYISADGIFAEVLSKRGNVYKIRNIGKTKEYYLVSDGGNYHAHGDTLAAAKDDLRFKVMAEKLKSEPIHADTMISVKYFRCITGACEYGTMAWMEANGVTVSEMRADELLPLLERTNAYGLSKFKSLITFS